MQSAYLSMSMMAAASRLILLVLAFIAILEPSVYGYCVENTSTNTAVALPTVWSDLLVFHD